MKQFKALVVVGQSAGIINVHAHDERQASDKIYNKYLNLNLPVDIIWLRKCGRNKWKL